jgi:hypothetical protein
VLREIAGSSRPSTNGRASSATACRSIAKIRRYYDHEAFKPWRVQALGFKAIRSLYPDYELWREFSYEYVFDKLAIDVINGSPLLREWVDDANATPGDLDAITVPDEQAWEGERQAYLRY